MDRKSIEKRLVAEKKWDLKGEVKSSNRPVNSLLETDVEFDTRLINVPITKEENATLFKYIAQRYRERTFDNYDFKKIKPEIKEETYDLEPIETNKEIFELYDKIESAVRAMLDYGTR